MALWKGRMPVRASQRRVLIVLLLVAVVASGLWSAGSLIRAAASGESEFEDLGKVLDVIALIRTQYVEPVDFASLIMAYVRSGTINGMIHEVLQDPYTRYLDEDAWKQMRVDVRGVYGGIGVYVGLRDGRITIIAPIEGTPGYRAGLRSGDRIVGVDGRSTQEMGLDEAVALMRGEAGTTVTLTIERDGVAQPFDVSITRAVVQSPAVSKAELLECEASQCRTVARADQGIGYIKLLQFSERAFPELKDAVARLERAGMKALVLDLRNNPGGLLDSAVDVADFFIETGPIVHVVGRDHLRETIEAMPQGTYGPIPVVVLVNGYSASASEIVAGALQDAGVATLVGTKTFGKGLVQTVIPLRDGVSGLSLTTARYLTAGGRDINKEGIVPDIVVEVPEDQLDAQGLGAGAVNLDDAQLQKALEIVRQQLAPAALRKAG